MKYSIKSKKTLTSDRIEIFLNLQNLKFHLTHSLTPVASLEPNQSSIQSQWLSFDIHSLLEEPSCDE